MENWNSLFYYFLTCYMLYNPLITFPLFYSYLFYFYFISSIANQFCRVIFAFIFGCAPFFFLLERNFKISRNEVTKTLYITFVGVQLNINLPPKRYIPISANLTKLLFFLPKKVCISIHLFYIKNAFLFSAQAANSLIKIIKHHRLSYVKNRNFRLAIFEMFV